MDINDPLLKIRFDGKSVGSGRIPVAHLLRFLANLNKALLRTSMVLTGEANSLRKGAPDQSNKQAVALDLVLLTHGSPAAVLGFERTSGAADDMFGEELGNRIIESALDGLQSVQQEGDILPFGCDSGVLMAWRDAGVLFSKDVSRIEFSLKHRPVAKVVAFTPEGLTNIAPHSRHREEHPHH